MSQIKSFEMEDIAYKDWSEHLDLVAASRGGPWLPAYGYMQQSPIHELFARTDSPDGAGCQQYFLETIQEESSDEMCSESDKSGPGGWNSDSDADSVIHVSKYTDDNDLKESASGILRKRMEVFDDDSDDERLYPPQANGSRTSSLIAFESLERQCEEQDEFRTSASSDPFGWRTTDSTSWRLAGSVSDPLLSSSSSSSTSDDDTLHLSLSSSASFRSSLTNDSRLRAYRSFDSLNLFDSSSVSCSVTDLSQSHNALDFEKEKLREQEEIVVRDKKLTATTANLTTIVDSSPGFNRGKLARASFHCIPTRKERKAHSAELLRSETNERRTSEPCLAPRPQHSVENLSEDSGFCDSRSTQVLAATPDSSDYSGGEETFLTSLQLTEEDQRSNGDGAFLKEYDGEINYNGGDEIFLTPPCEEIEEEADCNQEEETFLTSLITEEERGTEPINDDESSKFSYGAPSSAGRSRQSTSHSDRADIHSFLEELAAAPTADCVAYTPPRLSSFSKPEIRVNSSTTFHSSQVSCESMWDAQGMAGRLPAVSAPNLFTGDDASLTKVPLKTGGDDSPTGRGVTFCPWVSEVSWRNSFSSASDSVESSNPSTDELSNRSLEDLCVGEEDDEEIEVEEKTLPKLSKSVDEGAPLTEHNAPRDIPVVNGDKCDEMQLVPPTRLTTPGVASHVVPSESEIPNAGRISTSMPVRDVPSQDSGVYTRPVTIHPDMDDKKGANKSRFGGFFERFSFRRLSNRMSGKRKQKKGIGGANEKPRCNTGVTTGVPEYEDVTIIPLHAPEVVAVVEPAGRAGKPPLPPRVPGAARKTPPDVTSGTVSSGLRDGSRMPGVRSPSAIDSTVSVEKVLPRPLETDLDALEPIAPSPQSERCENKKTRSLMNLGLGEVTAPRPNLLATGKQSSDDRARSMEFLLDKENQVAAMAPENELQKGGPVMSEHQLRVQRSLQKLNVPDWYRNSSAANAPQGFLLKRAESSQGWQGLGSKTTSLSSLGSVTSTTRSPTSHIVSPTPHVFTRWSTSRLNSGATSSSTSPCGSARSSFHYRQPYLGWRSQERLTKRTPTERLSAGFLTQQRTPLNQQQTPSLTEVRSSIKEVTSAIVHYVEGSDDRGCRPDSRSPRGSNSRLCWVESSFVGSRPAEQPETPVTMETRPDRLDLSRDSVPQCVVSDTGSRKGSIGSATMDEILDSLLGLPPSSRSPSPRLADSAHAPGGVNSGEGAASTTKCTTDQMVRCRYSKCGKSASVADAKKTFKTCHNCAHVYCSRECRRAHWERHRRTCLHSRVGALCRQVLAAAKEDTPTRAQLSLLARRGYLTHGRGTVKCFFSCPEAAERFVSRGFSELGEPAYVRWSDLMPGEMGADLYGELIKLCKSYNPDTRLVLYVAVCVLSEVPTSGAVKWERQLVSRCCKVRLERSLLPSAVPPPLPPRRSSSDGADITRDMGDPDTLILTSLPGIGNMPPERAREVCVSNVQRELRQRGVSLRRQFPEVYRKLVAYAESTNERFPPTTIYPKDAAGHSFMCIIMPDADPERLELMPKDSGRVTTVDVGAHHPTTAPS